jgi:hypothetical protein
MRARRREGKYKTKGNRKSNSEMMQGRWIRTKVVISSKSKDIH